MGRAPYQGKVVSVTKVEALLQDKVASAQDKIVLVMTVLVAIPMCVNFIFRGDVLEDHLALSVMINQVVCHQEGVLQQRRDLYVNSFSRATANMAHCVRLDMRSVMMTTLAL